MQLFETQRLIARQLSHQDVPVLTDILSDPDVMKYSVRGVCDEEAIRKFINWCIECYSSHGIGPWALSERGSGDLVGFCGVGPELVGDVEEVNLGYRLARRFWHQGLATEAVKGVMRYAFDQKHCESVVVIIEPEHTDSVRVTEKAGFGDYTVQEFHNRLVRLYRMTREDWASQNRQM
ncbi:GNAT family N-acetyltransferase [Marinobacter sp. F4206]|uniref:GNAT family N-acetyltransferase n=1 Tax=Marinobacter sp. F4206 TaxID=2861777 RepID=UPI001C5D835C|nr:GNAT family N-acetyltransferase [Marinobacter sp. F4206]MBW4936174.1 GNAT family N-acetyltransferase [Marinobacter sp. F4206]